MRLVVPLLLLPALCACGKPSSKPCEGVAVSLLSANHVPMGTSVDYQGHHPPSSGNHWPCWATWGTSDRSLPEEQWVHNLEHGGVVLLYQCADATSCPQARDALAKVMASAGDAPTGGKRLLVTNDTDLGSPGDGGPAFSIAAVSWGFVLQADSVSEADLSCFIQAHQGKGPEDVPDNPPSACPQ